MSLYYKSPKDIFTAIEDIAVAKVQQPFHKNAMLGLLAGYFLSTGGLLAATAASRINVTAGDNSSFLQSLIYAAFFPVGLILIYCCGAELFTGNNLYLTVGLFSKKVSCIQVLKHWLQVWIYNFFGSIIIVILFTQLTGFVKIGNPIAEFLVSFSETKTSLSFLELITRGIGANFLICAGTWFTVSSNSTAIKAFAIWICAFTFLTIGFEHSIANMFAIPLGWMMEADFQWYMIFYQIIVVSFGNILGGGLLVGGTYWAAFMETKEQKTEVVAEDNTVVEVELTSDKQVPLV
ncbi:hypothetical protein RCL1_002126 [Eukaryota sp. TZLM3-RCL]